MTDTTIQTDVDTSDDGFDAFLSSFESDDAKKQRLPESDEGAPETQAETTEQTADTEGEPEEGSEDDNDPENQEFEIKVGEETKKATLRDLKRLYGQEAALTQKSQKASEQLRAAEEQITRTAATSKAILEKAQERYKPYEALDWLVLAQRMDTENFEQLRKDAAEAKRDVDFLTTEVDGFMRDQQTKAAQAYQVAAQECIKVLTDSNTGIEGFGQPLYNEMVAFAAEQGLPQARQSTSPAEYRILHMAMLYAKSQKAAKAAEGKVQKAVEKPTRTLKPGASKPASDGKRAAMAQLRQSGDPDDAVAAFMASF